MKQIKNITAAEILKQIKLTVICGEEITETNVYDGFSTWFTQFDASYNVWAGSYDGSMDVYESFRTIDAARALYDHIVTNYTDTPPMKRELNKVIRAAHRGEAA